MYRSTPWSQCLLSVGLAVMIGMLPARAENESDFGRSVEGSWYGSFDAPGFGSVPVLATLGREGTLTTTDGTDFAGGFQSGTHGSWVRVGANGIGLTLLGLSFDMAGNFTGYTRTRGNARFTGGRDTMTGNFRTDFFQPGQDPLDPSAVPHRSVLASFLVRRITAH